MWSVSFLKNLSSLSPRIIHKRFITNVTRVRFAPSPTGYLHLGGLRTALYNYLFAKSRNGVLILRIEDTDQSRKVEGALDALIRDLEWAGVESVEGPNMGGDFGPYVQSERLQIYEDHIKKLLYNGSAYRCFCSERRLNMLRREAARSRRIPKYDNRCRHLTGREVVDMMQAGYPSCIRFKLTSDVVSYEDLVYGGIAYDVTMNEGDPVLMKSDGYPTYHFANVVDDYLMGITHVLRGVEWQISTTKHLMLYRAFGWTPPQFGHLPLIVNPDGSKLSKRQHDVRVEDYRSKGIFPLALVNYITLSGGGFDHIPGEGIILKTMEELAQEFQIDAVSPHPTRLNPDLLEECNRLEIKRQLKDQNLSQELITKVQDLIIEKYPDENLNVSNDHIKNVLHWAQARMTRVEDLVTSEFSFLWILPSNTNTELDKQLLKELLENLESLDKFDEMTIKDHLREFSKRRNVKFPTLMKMLRGVLSGLREGPSVAEMMYLLGKGQSLERIKAVIR